MNREVRTIRPFSVPAELERALESVRFSMGAATCEPNAYITIDSQEEYLRCVPALSWAESDEAFAQFRSSVSAGIDKAGIPRSAAALLVTAYTPYLKITDNLLLRPLDQFDSLPRTVSFREERPDALRASTHGAVVTACVVLASDLERQALKPWRKGTWLARTSFRIETESAMQVFRPTPLDDAGRERLGLPRGTVRYFSIGDHEVLSPYESSAPPEFYVDAELLALINSAPGTPGAIMLQTQLACDFIASVITDCVSRTEDLADCRWEDIKDSMVGRIISLVSGTRASRSDREELLETIHTDPFKLLARVEHALQVRRPLLESFEGD